MASPGTASAWWGNVEPCRNTPSIRSACATTESTSSAEGVDQPLSVVPGVAQTNPGQPNRKARGPRQVLPALATARGETGIRSSSLDEDELLGVNQGPQDVLVGQAQVVRIQVDALHRQLHLR